MSETAAATAATIQERATATLPPHAITWFEIPVLDLDRATKFYETVLARTLKQEFYGEKMSIFPAEPTGLAGALVCREGLRPGTRGAMLYLDCTGFLEDATDRAAEAGGIVMTPVTVIGGGFGRYSTIRDTEGNQISLHSR